MPVYRVLFFIALIPLVALSTVPTPPRRVAVLSIELNDLSNQPVTPALPSRLHSLTAALREQLSTACGYTVVPIDSVAEASAQDHHPPPQSRQYLGGRPSGPRSTDQ